MALTLAPQTFKPYDYSVELTITTSSAEETEKVGQLIGQKLEGGEVIELVSDLGGGKTTFTRGLARGFGSKDRVSSPSFTISKVYRSGGKQMVHFDFYRLPEAGIVGQEIAELVNDPKTIVVVEWADVTRDVLPLNRLIVSIEVVESGGRQMIFKVPDSLQYLTKDIN